ncbi:MAG: methyltransferase [Bacteroidota bacterium]
MNKPFKFKEFTIHQDRSAMKVGTDGVLLGAWAAVDKNPNTILDIGAGTGLIALQLAQRSQAEIIDAIELDENAYEQCVENFEASLWGDRLFCYHAGLDEFVDEIDDTYDLIVSNPPFYVEEVSSGDATRDLARQNSSLPFPELFEGASRLLSESGTFAVIAPFVSEKELIGLAIKLGFFPNRITRVRGNGDADIKRSLMEFSWDEGGPITTELTIEHERHVYTKDYIELTKAFYLKM